MWMTQKYKKKKCIKKEEDVKYLEADLNKLYSWAKNNNIVFNWSKFSVIIYGENEDLENETNYLKTKKKLNH